MNQKLLMKFASQTSNFAKLNTSLSHSLESGHRRCTTGAKITVFWPKSACGDFVGRNSTDEFDKLFFCVWTGFLSICMTWFKMRHDMKHEIILPLLMFVFWAHLISHCWNQVARYMVPRTFVFESLDGVKSLGDGHRWRKEVDVYNRCRWPNYIPTRS